ncbi:hypothetical protein M3197_14095 [Sporosarcina aquimarina]|uniref:hypothetical protein n=1 Tax=Sporosarcina aquimarina TaxID=114975 RepID=UPI00203CF673|nr:hypothetical protein [Sporosarcina aquimarina]MCM3758593.1 hypothetical protein [Sporosarcina aquimarina]
MKRMIGLAVGILIVTSVCIFFGFTFQVPEEEKQQGVTGIFDVSDTGDIGFVTYEDGKPTLYVKSNGIRQVAQLPPNQEISDVIMMPGQKKVLYVNSDKTLSETSKSIVHEVDLSTGSDEVLFEKDAIITELALDVALENQLFYLQADIYLNYSPVASAYPHEFDVHSYDLKEKTQKQLTDLKKYNMTSLQVSGKEKSVYIQMDDDADANTAEEVFETKQRIFQIPLAQPDQPKKLFIPKDTEDLYDFVLVPAHSLLIYQAVSGTNSKGTYEYELFSYNWETKEAKQLTFQKNYAARPLLGDDGQLYYMMDYNFAGRSPEYELFRMNLEDGETEQVQLTE